MIVIDLPWPPKELSPNARFIGWRRHGFRRGSIGRTALDHGGSGRGHSSVPRLTGSDLELIAEFRMPDKRWRTRTTYWLPSSRG